MSAASEVRAERLVVGGDPAAWAAIGLTVLDDGSVPFLFTSLRIDPAAPAGIRTWELSGVARDVTSIDGLATVPVPTGTPTLVEHPNGGIELDHVVVLTNSLDRTCAAVEGATGAALKRIRDLGAMRQGFHRLGRGGLIVEVVERAEFDGAGSEFWGIVINVTDLDAAVALIGADRIGAAKDAVQPGRRIATVRAEAGLGLPVALMSTTR